MDDIFLTDLGLARKERNDAIARAEAAEGEVARMRVWQGHPDDLWEARCTVVIDDGMVVVGGTQKAVDETVRQLRRRVTAEAEVTRLLAECEARENVQARLIQERDKAEAVIKDVYEALGTDGIVNLGDAVARLRPRLRLELSALRARAEAAEADAAECRSERARYGDMMTDKLAAAEAEVYKLGSRLAEWIKQAHTAEATSAHWKELHGDRAIDLAYEHAKADALEAEVARLREALADIAEAADADDPESYDFSKEK
jgi:hypothetical protein